MATAQARTPSSAGLCGRKRPASTPDCAGCTTQCGLRNCGCASVLLAERMLSRRLSASERSRPPPAPPRISVSDVLWPAAALFTPAVAYGRPGAYDHFVAIDWRPKGRAATPNCPPCGFSYTFGAPGGVRAAIRAALKRADAKEARTLAALQTDEGIDSDSNSGTSSDTGHYSSSSSLSSAGDSGYDSSSSSGLSSGGGGGRCGSSTEPSQGSSTAEDALTSSADAGECVPEWSDDVALALARAAGPMLREPVLNELYIEWADSFGGFVAL